MPESAIADFVARFLADDRRGTEPIAGRVILSRKRLVFASGEGRKTVPLSDVFDVVVGHVPPHLSEYFDDAVAIAYDSVGGRCTAILEADAETITRFRTVLFKALLGGAPVRVKHPARIGGRYTDATAREGTISLMEGTVAFQGLEPALRIDLSSITHIEKADRTIGDRTRPALNVRFMDDGQAITAEVVMSTPRRMNLLGRYLRLEYSELLEDVREMELSDAESELLVALYSGADEGNLSTVSDMDPSTVTMLLNRLEGKDLVGSTQDGTHLTSLGRLAVGERVERVNA